MTASAPAEPKFDGVYDLVVIGAGINGTGIARDAAARGLRVALVEKENIGRDSYDLWSRKVEASPAQ